MSTEAPSLRLRQMEQPAAAREHFYIISRDRLTGAKLYSTAVADLETSSVSLVFKNSMHPFPELETDARLKDWEQRSKCDPSPPKDDWKLEDRIKTIAIAISQDYDDPSKLLGTVEKVHIKADVSGHVIRVPSLETEVLSMIPRVCRAAFPKMQVDLSTFLVSFAGVDLNARQMFFDPTTIALVEDDPIPGRQLPRLFIRTRELDLSAFKSERKITSVLL